MKNGNVVVKKSEIIYDVSNVRVIKNNVLSSDGMEHIFSVISIKNGAAVLPIDDEGNVYLVKEHKFAINKDLITVAGGAIEDGESPLESAKRELKEELGFLAKEWKDLGINVISPNMLDFNIRLFLAKGLDFVGVEREVTESMETANAF